MVKLWVKDLDKKIISLVTVVIVIFAWIHTLIAQKLQNDAVYYLSSSQPTHICNIQNVS